MTAWLVWFPDLGEVRTRDARDAEEDTAEDAAREVFIRHWHRSADYASEGEVAVVHADNPTEEPQLFDVVVETAPVFVVQERTARAATQKGGAR